MRTSERRGVSSRVALHRASIGPARARRRLASARGLARSRVDARRAALVLCARSARQNIEAHLDLRNAHAHARAGDVSDGLTTRRAIAVSAANDGLGHAVAACARLQPRAVLAAHERSRNAARAANHTAARKQRGVDPSLGRASRPCIATRTHSSVRRALRIELAVLSGDRLHDTRDRPQGGDDDEQPRDQWTEGVGVSVHRDQGHVHTRGQRRRRTYLCGTGLSEQPFHEHSNRVESTKTAVEGGSLRGGSLARDEYVGTRSEYSSIRWGPRDDLGRRAGDRARGSVRRARQ